MSDPDQTARHTVDADEATMEEMRRYAEAARRKTAAASNGAHTIDANQAEMELMRRYAEAARAAMASGSQSTDVTLPVPDVAVVDAEVGDLAEVGEDQRPAVEGLDGDSIPVPPDRPGDRWQPPTRTVLPTPPQPQVEPTSAGLWKPAAIVFAIVAAVLAAVLIFGGESDDDAPGGTTVPGSAVVPDASQPVVESP